MEPEIKKAATTALTVSVCIWMLLYSFDVSTEWLSLFPAPTRIILISVVAALLSFPPVLSRYRGNGESRGRLFYWIGGASIMLTLIASASLVFFPVPKQDADAFVALRQFLLQGIGMFGGIFGASALFHGIRLFSDYNNRE